MASKNIEKIISKLNSSVGSVDIKKMYDIIAAMATINAISSENKASMKKMDLGISEDSFSDLKKYAKLLNENTDALEEYIKKQEKINNNDKASLDDKYVAQLNMRKAIQAQNIAGTVSNSHTQVTRGLKPSQLDVTVGDDGISNTASDKNLIQSKSLNEIYSMLLEKIKKMNKLYKEQIKLISNRRKFFTSGFDFELKEIEKKVKAKEVEIQQGKKEILIMNESIKEKTRLNKKAMNIKRKEAREHMKSQAQKMASAKEEAKQIKKKERLQRRVNKQVTKERIERLRILKHLKTAAKRYLSLSKLASRMTFVMTAALSYKVFEGFQRGISESIAGYIKFTDEINKTLTRLDEFNKQVYNDFHE